VLPTHNRISAAGAASLVTTGLAAANLWELRTRRWIVDRGTIDCGALGDLPDDLPTDELLALRPKPGRRSTACGISSRR
jgi:hypothetical protein